MSKKKQKYSRQARDKPNLRSAVWIGDWGKDNSLCCPGYTPLSHNPEISTAVDRIATLVGSMTIHLMRNGEGGDERIIDGMSRMVDISPNGTMGRLNWMKWIVRTMLLTGDGNAVCRPVTEKGYLRRLVPIPPSSVSFMANGDDYLILINGRRYEPDELLHFVTNPDESRPWMGTGYRVSLREVAHNLQQAAATERGFMESKWKPSLIVKVDALTEEFSSPEGRTRLLNDYIASGEAGQPWMIPADQFSIEQVKPLTLNDLALADTVKLDKATVASIIGVPPFVLGVGEFKRDAWNNFISTTIMTTAQIVQQELTGKLLVATDRYFRFNPRSLYNYELTDLAMIGNDEYVRGIMSGNEVRDWLGLEPRDGLDDLVILENYIPLGSIGEQKKLIQGGEQS